MVGNQFFDCASARSFAARSSASAGARLELKTAFAI